MSLVPVLGFDEVGRGSLAGPVVVACVLGNRQQMASKPSNIVIKDSKKMSRSQRERSSLWIRQNYAFGIAEASALEIDSYGIGYATKLAAHRSYTVLKAENPQTAHLRYKIKNDGRDRWFENSWSIVHGDSLVPEISMASIIAKVYRDALMTQLVALYPNWGFDKHVGYGTQSHREKIQEFGLLDHIHRITFCRKIIAED